MELSARRNIKADTFVSGMHHNEVILHERRIKESILRELNTQLPPRSCSRSTSSVCSEYVDGDDFVNNKNKRQYPLSGRSPATVQRSTKEGYDICNEEGFNLGRARPWSNILLRNSSKEESRCSCKAICLSIFVITLLIIVVGLGTSFGLGFLKFDTAAFQTFFGISDGKI